MVGLSGMRKNWLNIKKQYPLLVTIYCGLTDYHKNTDTVLEYLQLIRTFKIAYHFN